MVRKPRIDVGGEIYHALNRANERSTIFHSPDDYRAFESILFETLEDVGVVCLAYVIMPNHWHLLLKTYEDGALARFMQLPTQAHTQFVHVQRKTIGSGHLYQGRYKSFVVDTGNWGQTPQNSKHQNFRFVTQPAVDGTLHWFPQPIQD